MGTHSYSIYHIQTLIHLPFNSYRSLSCRHSGLLRCHAKISLASLEKRPGQIKGLCSPVRSICSEMVCDSIYILSIHCTQHLNIVFVPYSVSLWTYVLSYHATFFNLMFTVWYDSTCGDGIRLDCRTSS